MLGVPDMNYLIVWLFRLKCKIHAYISVVYFLLIEFVLNKFHQKKY